MASRWFPDPPSRDPLPARGRPRPPAWLDRVGKAAFRWVVGQLEAMRVLASSDAKAIERYCQVYARWREAEELLRVHGQVMLVKREDGSLVPRRNPAVAVASDLAQQLARLESDLGLTPASRSRLEVRPQPRLAETDRSHFRPRVVEWNP